MKFAVFGAGAVGGVVGARLLATGQEVALITRGARLEAIRERGLFLRSKVFGETACKPFATDQPADIGPVDVVVLTLKAHSVPAAAPAMAPLFGAQTSVVTLQNGLPWWYFHGLGKPWEGARLESVDPGGVIAGLIDVRRVVGGLAYCAAAVPEPGVVEHTDAAYFPLGELDGSQTERVERIADAFNRAGLQAPIRADIRHDIWVKMLGNVPFNPISALTGATLGQMVTHPLTGELIRAIMEEVRGIASAVGVEITVSTERRMAGVAKVPHKSSMLQDLEAGRPPELGPIVGAALELADMAGLAAPNLRAVHACAKLLFEERLQPGQPGSLPSVGNASPRRSSR